MFEYIQSLCQAARLGAQLMREQTTEKKNTFLISLADLLKQNTSAILRANQLDVEFATQKKYDQAFIDRLSLNQKTIEGMIESLHQIAKLPDVIGEISMIRQRPTGIQVGKMRVPLGVIAMIYESRPNVTIDAAALCIKSGNAVILRGGSEAYQSNCFLFELIQRALTQAKLPIQAVQFIKSTDREMVRQLIQRSEDIDVLIPRGGKSLIERLAKESRVPMIKHLDGICHVYVDQDADFEKALAICDNAKTHRYGTCNTMETLLIAQAIAKDFLPMVARIYQEKKVELRVDAQAMKILERDGLNDLKLATEEDWQTEYLAPILSIKIVKDVKEAMAHIEQYSSKHTDAIVTENFSTAQRFLQQVDSASVIVNASTRFADGFEYGLGAEIGISNDKLHVRGPVGIEGLTSLKYIVLGHGEIRQ